MNELVLQNNLYNRVVTIFDEHKTVLLSGSVGRRQIVKKSGLPWLFAKSNFNEDKVSTEYDRLSIDTYLKAADYSAFLAKGKVESAKPFFKNATLISADTVVFNKKLLEKPTTEKEVYDMVLGLNNTIHQVVTAVSIVNCGHKSIEIDMSFNNSLNEIIVYDKNTFVAVSHVTLTGVTKEHIKKMIETENPYRCSGGFTIDGCLKKHFSILKGTEDNVVGLPICEILTLLNGTTLVV